MTPIALEAEEKSIHFSTHTCFFFFLPPVSIFLQLILYQKEFHFMLQGTVPLSPTISEHSAHSVPWTGWPLPDQAVCSVRPGTEQFFKLWTGCKQHLPKKSSKETKESWRECWRWPPFSSRCGSEIHPPTPHRDELEARWGNQLKAWSWSPTCPPPPPPKSTLTTSTFEGPSTLESKLTH